MRSFVCCWSSGVGKNQTATFFFSIWVTSNDFCALTCYMHFCSGHGQTGWMYTSWLSNFFMFYHWKKKQILALTRLLYVLDSHPHPHPIPTQFFSSCAHGDNHDRTHCYACSRHCCVLAKQWHATVVTVGLMSCNCAPADLVTPPHHNVNQQSPASTLKLQLLRQCC